MSTTKYKSPREDIPGNLNENDAPGADPLHSVARQLAEAMKPFRLFARQFEEVTKPLRIFSRQIDEQLEPLRTLSRQIAEKQDAIRSALEPLAVGFNTFGTIWRMYDRAYETGWILCPDVSDFAGYQNILKKSGEDHETLDKCISEFYSVNWPRIGFGLRSEFSTYSLDELSKSAFCDALTLHGEGKYDLVPRILFPEIERVMRIKLFNNSQDRISCTEMIDKFGNAYSWPEVTGRSPIAHHILFGELVHWVFASQQERGAVKKHCVPNRHEVIHGLDIALTFKDSVNMLLFAFFMMGVMQSEARDIPPERENGRCAPQSD